MRIRIVDPVTLYRRADGEVGEIWVAGESVALGYWNKPLETAATFGAFIAGTHEGPVPSGIEGPVEGPFLRTGDLGCISNGHLFVTGRLKDVFIVRGLKHYPHDIEATAEQSHPAVRPGCCAAFAVEEAVRAAADAAELMIIGGADLFRLFLPHAGRVHLTRVHADVAGDVLWSPLDDTWGVVESEPHAADERHAYPMTFEVWEKRR